MASKKKINKVGFGTEKRVSNRKNFLKKITSDVNRGHGILGLDLKAGDKAPIAKYELK